MWVSIEANASTLNPDDPNYQDLFCEGSSLYAP